MEAFKTVIVAAKEAQDAALEPERTRNAVVTAKVNFSDADDSSEFGLTALVDGFSDALAAADAADFEVAPTDLDAARDAAKTKVDFVKESVVEAWPR